VGNAGSATRRLAVQVLLAATVPLEKEIDEAPATGANVATPQPEVENTAGVATTIWLPASNGSVSVKLAPAIAAALGLPMVNVSVEVPPATAGDGENALAKLSAVGSTILAIQLLTEKSAL
jgi:hypothetical protein